MPRISLATRSSLVALTLAAFVGISGLLIARQSAAPAQSKEESKPGSQAKDQLDPAKTKSKSKAKPDRKSKARTRHDPPGFYMGREIAPVMSWEGVDWLFRETRIEQEEPEAMLNALKIPRGATVADVGAGAGYHSIPLARRVGPKGTVLATDLQPEMLKMLQANARTAGVTNIKPIRCTQTDPRLPEGKVDLVLMVDVYHECSDPEATLQGLMRALKPRGRLVLVEFRAGDPKVEIRPEHTMTLEQVRREVEPQGFTFKESLEFVPWQRIIIFEKPGEPAQAPRPAAAAPKPQQP